MSIFARRPIDLARLAAAVASEAGWQIERWDAGGGWDGGGVGGGAAGAEVGGVRRRWRLVPGYGGAEGAVAAPSAEQVSIVVSGGELRFPARVTITAFADDDASGTDAFAGIRSDHIPRTLPPPELRAVRVARARGLVVRLVEHPTRGTLDDALARADGLAIGEAVTVLAAVARGLADLHAGGRAGASLAAWYIGFRDDGCPILTGIDRLRPLDRGTAREDLGAFAELAATVCSAVRGGTGAALLAASTAGGHRSWDDVIAAVLRAADPIAIARPSETRGDPAALDRTSRGERAAPMNADAAPTGRQPARDGADANLGEPTPIVSSWDLEATVLRHDVRAAVSALPREGAPGSHGGRLAEATPRDGGGRDTVLTVSGGGSPAPELAGWESAGREREPAVWSGGERPPVGTVWSGGCESDATVCGGGRASDRAEWDGGLRAQEHAEWDVGGRRPERTEWNGVATSRRDRALGAAERVLHEVGDRPIGRLVGAARAWAAERPLLVGIALVPLVGVLLALVLVPADGQAAEVVGKSSSALLREGGTGPNR
jgi:hypothetical protein